MNPIDLLIPAAHAQAAGAAAPAGAGSLGLLFPILLVGIMYFLMIRPQMKRAKEHRAMVDALTIGDEVIVGGGIVGVITALGDAFVTVEIADGVKVRVQRGAIANVLPKGTLKSS